MASLDDIWDAPVDASPPSLPSKRPRSSLFLADSDDEEPPYSQAKSSSQPALDVDIDAIFAAELDDGDDPFAFKPITPALDTEALRREAEARHARAIPPLTPHAILPSSSPPRDMDGDKDGDSKGKGKDANGEGKKDRKKPIRLDEGRLLGPNGFPQLVKDTKHFKIKGKGHEATDLNRLLQIYQFWTHKMYPKTQFRDTVGRVEKLCHSKRMNVALSVWRDEAHGRVNGKNPDADGDGVIDLTDDEAETSNQPQPTTTAADSDVAEYASSSSRAPSRPPSSSTGSDLDMDEDADFDIDALIREEEERIAKEKAARLSAPKATYKEKGADMGMMNLDDDEVEAMWDELNAFPPLAHPAAVPPPPKALDTASASTRTPTDLDEDEAMWDVLREMESTAPKTVETATPLPAQESTSGVAVSSVEDDWDDMYI